MAQYRFSVRDPISRGKGQSAVAKAAYNAREKLRDERTGELKDYSRGKDDVLFSGIFVDPKRNAPEWTKDRGALWNAAVAAEKRKDAREAQEIIVNLPHELTDQQRRFMLTDFVREQITRGTGRVADVNIHRPPEQGDDRNYHAHILLTVREIGPEGFTGKRLEVTPEQIQSWKEKWAERGAKELRKAGFELEADRWLVGHLSLERQRQAALERGDLAHAETLNREPTKHRGPAASAMERKGEETDRGNIDREKFTAAQEAAKLRAELEQIGEEIRREEMTWEDQLAHAAIEKEKIEGRFAEPGAQRQAPRPIPPELVGTAAEIRLAYSLTNTGQEFANALEDRGMILAAVDRDDIEREKARTGITEKRKELREGELVVINQSGHLYRLTERNTGESWKAVAEHLKDIDRASLFNVKDARAVMDDLKQHRLDERAEHFEAERRERPLRGSAIDIGFAYRTTADPRAFVASLAERGIILAVATKEEAEESHTQAEAARAEGRLPRATGFKEHETVAVNQYGDVYRLSERITGSTFGDMQRYLRTLDRSAMPGIEDARDYMRYRADEEYREYRDRKDRDRTAKSLLGMSDIFDAGDGEDQHLKETILDRAERRTIENERAAERPRNTRDR